MTETTPTTATGAIIIVDDDDAVRRSTARLLVRAGHRVFCFERGDDFLEAEIPAEVDIILLDLRMPEPSGIEVLRALRQREAVPPVIVVTGHGDAGIAAEAMRLRAAEFLEKPYSADLLLEVIARVRARRRDSARSSPAE
jgi:FixJ family two-component response regulator